MVILVGASHLILVLNPDAPVSKYNQQTDDNRQTTVSLIGDEFFSVSTALDPKRTPLNQRRSSDAGVNYANESLKLINGCPNNQTLLEFIFTNPRLRFLPLLVYPYFGPFISSIGVTLAR